jgi:predicted RNase H-like nuclease (RuvC/YqgF family)
MIEINGRELAVWLPIVAAIGGFIAWLFMRLLDSRKEIISMRYEIDQIKNEMKKKEWMEKTLNQHESEINVLIEKTRKL